jgi:hypothetical protein
VSCVVIIRERKHFQNLFGVDHSFQHVNPILQVVLAVDDDLVPRLCLLLDAFTVTEPTDVGPICGC